MSQLEVYSPSDSWLQRIDPRVKLLAVVVGSVVGLSYRHLGVLAGLLVCAHLALLSARIPIGRLRWLWSRLLPLLAMILVLQPVFAPGPGPNLVRIGPLRWTAEGCLDGASFALRAAALAFLAAILLLSTNAAQMVRALVRLGLPYPWGLTIGLAVRYLPETYGLFVSMSEAQQARGWVLGQGQFLKRARSYLPVLVATIIASLRKADALGLALAARGLGYTRHRTTLHDLQLRPVDWLALALILPAFVGLMLLRFWFRWGGTPW